MTTSEYAIWQENRLIAKFKREFKEKTGKHIEVRITGNKEVVGSIPAMPLADLINIVDSFLPTALKSRKYSIVAKNRSSVLIKLRSCYAIIAREMGYTLTETAWALNGRHHTTILHNLAGARAYLNSDLWLSATYKEIRKRVIDAARNYELDDQEQSGGTGSLHSVDVAGDSGELGCSQPRKTIKTAGKPVHHEELCAD